MKSKESFESLMREKPLSHFKLLVGFSLLVIVVGLGTLIFLPAVFKQVQFLIIVSILSLPLFIFAYIRRSNLPDMENTPTNKEYVANILSQTLVLIFVGIPLTLFTFILFASGYNIPGTLVGMAATFAIIPGIRYRFVYCIALLISGFLVSIFLY
jgi:hypothetical protein